MEGRTRYLLSDDIHVMTGLDLEIAVVRPQVYRVGDAGNTPLIHRLCRFSTGDDEFLVRIALPVYEEQRKLCEEAVVDVAEGSDGLRARVAVQTSLQSLNSSHKGVPWLIVVRRRNL